MKLRSANYISPIATEGKFDEVFIEETNITIEKNRKYMSITFEMHYFKNQERVVLDERTIAFYGMSGDVSTSNKLAVLLVDNENYQEQVDAVPIMVEAANPDYISEFVIIESGETVPNPEYNSETPEFITISNPDYDAQVAEVPAKVSVPFIQYLYEHQGVLPEVYEVVDWGFPSFQDALQYFDGGDKNNLEISIPDSFARGWLLNTLIMKNEKVGVQFQFVE